MGKMKELYIDYLNEHPELDPQDDFRPINYSSTFNSSPTHSSDGMAINKRVNTMNRYTRSLNKDNKDITAKEIREDITLVAAMLLLALLVSL